MTIHDIFRVVSPVFRRKRFKRFCALIQPAVTDSILDVGGCSDTWTPYERIAKRIDLLNIYEVDCDEKVTESHGVSVLVGDGCALEMGSESYDIVFSNSVIEHVGTWENQLKFAAEMDRVGRRLWIQTPARGFFMEPHYITPFIHWFPKSIQRRLLRNFTLRGLISRPSQQEVDGLIDEIRLLTYREMLQLFPDCKILKEKFLWVFTKSYVAWRSDR